MHSPRGIHQPQPLFWNSNCSLQARVKKKKKKREFKCWTIQRAPHGSWLVCLHGKPVPKWAQQDFALCSLLLGGSLHPAASLGLNPSQFQEQGLSCQQPRSDVGGRNHYGSLLTVSCLLVPLSPWQWEQHKQWVLQ